VSKPPAFAARKNRHGAGDAPGKKRDATVTRTRAPPNKRKQPEGEMGQGRDTGN